MGERLDPEALRRVMTRYFELSRGTLERHGATVEKFIGDAVMAVFGIPTVHEDDALRAARAALELRRQVSSLGIELRIGVNTGEVVAEEGETLVTGDAVNVPARLEQAASPGEILLGDATCRFVGMCCASRNLGPGRGKGQESADRGLALARRPRRRAGLHPQDRRSLRRANRRASTAHGCVRVRRSSERSAACHPARRPRDRQVASRPRTGPARPGGSACRHRALPRLRRGFSAPGSARRARWPSGQARARGRGDGRPRSAWISSPSTVSRASLARLPQGRLGRSPHSRAHSADQGMDYARARPHCRIGKVCQRRTPGTGRVVMRRLMLLCAVVSAITISGAASAVAQGSPRDFVVGGGQHLAFGTGPGVVAFGISGHSGPAGEDPHGSLTSPSPAKGCSPSTPT